MGYPSPIFSAPPGDISEAINSAIDEVERGIEEAESIPDVFLALASVTRVVEYGPNENNSRIAGHHFGNEVAKSLVSLLDTLDEIAGTQYHDEFTELTENLAEQGFLNETSGIILIYYMSDIDSAYSYANSYIHQILPMLDDFIAIHESERHHPGDLLPLYGQWGGLAEEALPVTVAIIRYLKNEEVDLEDIRGQSLSNYIDTIDSFHLLPTIGSNLNSKLRNSVSHGGPRGGFNINPIERTVQFRFVDRGEVNSIEMSFTAFEAHVFETLGAVIAMFLFPIYLVAMHSCIKIGEFEREAEG